jgi:hypothetical protein
VRWQAGDDFGVASVEVLVRVGDDDDDDDGDASPGDDTATMPNPPR